jgi:hypothetical protein
VNGGHPAPIRRIVVGVDGSDGATRAVMWSARPAPATGAEVVAAYAIESPVFLEDFPLVTGPFTIESWDVAWKEWREHTRELLEERWCRPLAAAGVRYRAEMIAGGSKALSSSRLLRRRISSSLEDAAEGDSLSWSWELQPSPRSSLAHAGSGGGVSAGLMQRGRLSGRLSRRQPRPAWVVSTLGPLRSRTHGTASWNQFHGVR